MLKPKISSLHHPLLTTVPNARHTASAGPDPSRLTERASNSAFMITAVFQTAADIPPSLTSFLVFMVQWQRNTTHYTAQPVLPPTPPSRIAALRGRT